MGHSMSWMCSCAGSATVAGCRCKTQRSCSQCGLCGSAQGYMLQAPGKVQAVEGLRAFPCVRHWWQLVSITSCHRCRANTI
jgi:hypothetical protein